MAVVSWRGGELLDAGAIGAHGKDVVVLRDGGAASESNQRTVGRKGREIIPLGGQSFHFAVSQSEFSQAEAALAPNAIDDAFSIDRPGWESAVWKSFGQVLGLARTIGSHHHYFRRFSLARPEKAAEPERNPLTVGGPGGYHGRPALVLEDNLAVGAVGIHYRNRRGRSGGQVSNVADGQSAVAREARKYVGILDFHIRIPTVERLVLRAGGEIHLLIYDLLSVRRPGGVTKHALCSQLALSEGQPSVGACLDQVGYAGRGQILGRNLEPRAGSL